MSIHKHYLLCELQSQTFKCVSPKCTGLRRGKVKMLVFEYSATCSGFGAKTGHSWTQAEIVEASSKIEYSWVEVCWVWCGGRKRMWVRGGRWMWSEWDGGWQETMWWRWCVVACRNRIKYVSPQFSGVRRGKVKTLVLGYCARCRGLGSKTRHYRKQV